MDLRAGSAEQRAERYGELESALEAEDGMHLGEDAELAAILARRASTRELDRGREQLDHAATAFGKLACATAEEHVAEALLSFAAAQSLGLDVHAERRRALVYRLLCADRDGEIDRAMSAAQELRALGSEASPKEIPDNVWTRYPTVDAGSNYRTAAVSMASDPAGASIWIDFRPAGRAPSTVLVPEGEHIVAMTDGELAVAKRVLIDGRSRPVILTLPRGAGGSWSGLSAEVHTLHSGSRAVDGKTIAELLSAIETSLAFVLREPGSIEVWFWNGRSPAARLLGSAPTPRAAIRVARASLLEVPSGAGLDPSAPLLVEDQSDQEEDEDNDESKWWLYGAVLGAAVLGTTIILAHDLSDDEQRIEVRFP